MAALGFVLTASAWVGLYSAGVCNNTGCFMPFAVSDFCRNPSQNKSLAIRLRTSHDSLILNKGHLRVGPHVASRGDIPDAHGERRA